MPDGVTPAYTCALCTTPARYKCPRCATPTCSLPCSRRHKQDAKCTGERDKVQYVPMNAYGWGVMMRDYCYLEDIGRKVTEWGSEIVRGGYTTNVGASRSGTRTSFSRRKPTAGNSKRDWLRAHLETLGIDVELLPVGMERRNLNQSSFDQKSKRCLLTIEFIFFPPATLASVSPPLPPSRKMLSHRNGLSGTLLSTLQRQVSMTLSKSQKQMIPDWLSPLVTPHPEAPECFVPPHCYMRANAGFPHPPSVAYYHKLDPTVSLGELLRKTSFVEFPTIHVFDPEASSFCGTVIDKSGSMVRIPEDGRVNDARETKRRKLNKAASLNTVFSLIGEYGSEASSHSEEETTSKRQTGLATLEVYSASDDEGAPTDDEDRSKSDDDVPVDGDQLDPARLVEIMRQARCAADEDILDWGDEWDTDTEEQTLNGQL